MNVKNLVPDTQAMWFKIMQIALQVAFSLIMLLGGMVLNDVRTDVKQLKVDVATGQSNIYKTISDKQLDTLDTINALTARVVALESNKFTAKEALDQLMINHAQIMNIRQELTMSCAAIKEQLAKLPQEYPPKWVSLELEKQSQRIAELEREVRNKSRTP